MLKGYRTYAVAAAIALVTAVLPALTGLDWVAVLKAAGVGETWAVPIAGVIVSSLMTLMRSVTTTPPGKMGDGGGSTGTGGLYGHAWLGAILAAVMLSGCAQMTAAVETSDNALARLSNNSLPAACVIVGVAEGYFGALAPRISAANHARYEAASAVASRVCINRPSDTAAAMITLAQAWADIQAATKVQ